REHAIALQQHACLGMEALGRSGACADQVRDQRPATRGAWLHEAREPRPVRRLSGRGPEKAQRRERVVRHLARPDEVPERIKDYLLVAAAAGAVEVSEKARAPRLE